MATEPGRPAAVVTAIPTADPTTTSPPAPPAPAAAAAPTPPPPYQDSMASLMSFLGGTAVRRPPVSPTDERPAAERERLTRVPLPTPAPAAVGTPVPVVAPAAEPRPLTPAEQLLADLERDPTAFDFFQAVRAVECARPDLPPIGRAGLPDREAVRFTQEPDLAFAASPVGKYRAGSDAAGAARMTVQFMGLFGPNGPMPTEFTRYARLRRRRGDRTLARFVDVFHHRLVSLFYRAWAVHQPAVAAARPADDPFATCVASLIGLGSSPLRDRDAVPDAAKHHFAGRLAPQVKGGDGLAAVLRGYFGVPAAVEPFVGRWIDLPAENLTRLGDSPTTGTLGESALLGEQAWDCQHKFRIRLGPMSLAMYDRLLPGRPADRRLDAWVRNYAGLGLEWDVQLVLRADAVPQLGLGRVGELGWSTWLLSDPESRDRDDLLIDCDNDVAREVVAAGAAMAHAATSGTMSSGVMSEGVGHG